MNKNCCEKRTPILLLTVIVLLLTVYMLFWSTQKQGFHIDEMFSVMDIRGDKTYRPYTEDGFFNTWHIASDLESTIGVTAGKAFSEINWKVSLYQNLLHIAYSFHTGGFSVLPGLVLNIIFYTGTLVVIYLLSRLFIKNDCMALLPVIAWGVSSAAVNLVLFIRFYTFKTFICVLLAYAVLIAVKNGFNKWMYPVAIALITYIGTFIHQYFFIFAFFLSGLVCLYLLVTKKIIPLLKFAGAMILPVAAHEIVSQGGIGRMIVFPEAVAGAMPEAVTEVISGTGTDTAGFISTDGGGISQAHEAAEKLISGGDGYSGRIQTFLEIINEALFGNAGVIAVFALIAVLILVFCINYKKPGSNSSSLLLSQTVHLWLITGGVCVLYLLLIARIAPFLEIRYMFCITPLISILVFSLLINALNAAGFKEKKPVFIMVLLLCLILPAGNIRSFNLHWEKEKSNMRLGDYRHLPVICIGDEDWQVASCYPQLFEFEDGVLFALTGDTDIEVINEKNYNDGALLLLWHEIDYDDTGVDWSQSGLENSRYVTNLVRHKVYLLG